MESLNRVELKGTLGSINLTQVGDKKHARFSVATDYAYRNKDGEAVIETTWPNVAAFEGKYVQDIEKLETGKPVKVTGRLQIQRFTGMDGIERTSVDVICSRLTILPEDTEMQYEM